MTGRVVVLALLLSGCVLPSPKVLSAGQVGCPPNEIAITELRNSFGGGRTWHATCRTKSFYCTEHTDRSAWSSSSTGTSYSSASASSSNVHCAPEAKPDPPSGAGGFTLGGGFEAEAEKCTAAGAAWTPAAGGGLCSATAKQAGFAARSVLANQEGQVAQIVLEGVRATNLAEYEQILGQLEKKYGPGRPSEAISGCRRPFEEPCVSGAATVKHEWVWDDRFVRLQLAGTGEQRKLRVVYQLKSLPAL